MTSTVTVESIAARMSAYGGSVSPGQIHVLPVPHGKGEVADATTKAVFPTASGPGFLIVSGSGNPNLVQRGVDNIALARAKVGPECADAILAPIFVGEIGSRTFAVWERQRLFPSGRGSKLVMRWLYASRILDWAHALCVQSLGPALDVQKQYVAPLAAVAGEEAFPLAMRRHAKRALDRIGDWQPMQCIQHGDFWEGNVLRPVQGNGLFVIDWSGAKMGGYPVADIARMLLSLDCRRRVRDHYLEKLTVTLSCSHDDVVAYVLAAAGDLGANLECFPVARYRQMSVGLFDYLTKR